MLQVESTKFIRLDILRFIAATGIVFFHFRGQFGLSHRLLDSLHSLSVFVDLFFVISGVVIAHVYSHRMTSIRQYGHFMRARIARLVPLHWVTLALFIIIWLVSSRLGIQANSPGKYDVSCIIPSALMIHSLNTCHMLAFNYVSWSISAEMVVYTIFPLIVVLGANRPYALMAFAITTILLMYYFFSGQGDDAGPWWDWSSHYGAVRAIPAFTFGFACYAIRDNLAKHLPVGPLCWILLGIFFALVLAGVPAGFLLPLMYLIPFFALAADTRCRPRRVMVKLASLGQLTYSIYMVHPLVATVFLTVLGDKIFHLSGRPMIVWSIGSMLAVFPVAYLSFRFFEAPSRRLINSGFGKGRSKESKYLEARA